MNKETSKDTLIRDSDYYYTCINPDIEKSFTPEQKQEIKNLLKLAVREPARKIVDIRVHFWFIKNLYLAFFLGVDLRKKLREYPVAGSRAVKVILTILLSLFLVFIIALIIFLGYYLAEALSGNI